MKTGRYPSGARIAAAGIDTDDGNDGGRCRCTIWRSSHDAHGTSVQNAREIAVSPGRTLRQDMAQLLL
jgi:hypothetical protein